ncbi:hypothetical protein [Chondromyces crocatus]|uniref:Uncharacterized protein n=1 Tax=Chondromyces crocatus TaxID=52 RepID=A0A0K1EHG6_CHOCO|nr:hypothetical protein [Chondromyces crocatus]AKT40316.1 uncharacterized protein CMC5_044690 [Chondromyces crocatus]
MRVAFVILGVLLGCGPHQGEITPPDVPDTDHCQAAERRLEALQCMNPRGEPMWVNRLGERFAETCRVTQDEGGVFLNPRCIAGVSACSEVDACAQQP